MSRLKEAASQETGIQFLKEKLGSGGFLFLDIDGTVKGPKTEKAPLGFDSDLPGVLHHFQGAGVMVGACTSQSPFELHSFLREKVDDTSLFEGVNVFEDGHIVVMPGKSMTSEYQVLASAEVLLEIERVKARLRALWFPAEDQDLKADGWGFFPFVSTPVILPEVKYQGAVTMSVWEKGPDTHDPSYQGEYEPVKTFVGGLISALGISGVDLVEAGNGTLRIIQKGLSKASTLGWLAERGIVDLGQSVYVGDGFNDVEPAGLIKKAGGGVIAVGNAISQLKQLATYTCSGFYSHGVLEALTKVAQL